MRPETARRSGEEGEFHIGRPCKDHGFCSERNGKLAGDFEQRDMMFLKESLLYREQRERERE